MNFAEVILPIPLHRTFTYVLPDNLTEQAQVGSRVIVLFGSKKIITGVIHSLHQMRPEGFEPKEVIDILDETPSITSNQITFFNWISRYYMCAVGEVVQAALPAGLKISSESYLSLNDDFDPDEVVLTDKEEIIVHHLTNGDLKIQDIGKILNIQSPHHHIKKLADKHVIQLFEQLNDKYTAKTEKRIKLAPSLLQADALDDVAAQLEKKPKQYDVLMAYLRLTQVDENPGLNERGIPRKALINQDLSLSSIKTLVKNGVLEEWDQRVSRVEIGDNSDRKAPILSTVQGETKSKILHLFQEKDTVLLKGVTGSGKTEIYISLIMDIISSGGTVLYLLPEIALTTQIIKRLAAVFGNDFGVYHSKYSDNERVEIYENVLHQKYSLVVGVRSAVFLPFSNLSLIIVDEEHENSYKQFDPAPRYHARDAAIYLAGIFKGKTLLGTATPSIESYYNATHGKYGLVNLDQRYADVSLPTVEIVNMVKEKSRKRLKGNFSSILFDRITKELEAEKQIIIFQNRRGYAPFLSCEQCGHIPKCPNCDVSLTYHAHTNFIMCHYCGYKKETIHECPDCKSTAIKAISYGTEKLEEELSILFPDANIGRMDLDSTRSKFSYEKIINSFESGEIDILVGTQMVAKGLDFDHVTLVGIFDTDRMIHFPDFRSHERAFQLMYQVSGRAGRKKDLGSVLIQTNNPNQKILELVRTHDYESFYRGELDEREIFKYPPFYRIIKIIVKHKDKSTSFNAAQFLVNEAVRSLGNQRVNGPVEPIISRIRNQYLYDITIKLEKQGLKLAAIKEFLLNSRNMLQSQRSYRSVRVIFDVDPV
ncbi:MAG: primosomal protein N' [Cyclobacteriaceae bacterium]